MSQEKLQKLIMQNVGGEGGGRVKEVYYEICASRELCVNSASACKIQLLLVLPLMGGESSSVASLVTCDCLVLQAASIFLRLSHCFNGLVFCFWLGYRASHNILYESCYLNHQDKVARNIRGHSKA